MNIDTIVQIISQVGFPIVACGAMFWKVNKQDEQHKEEMTAIIASLDKNTEAITALKNSIK